MGELELTKYVADSYPTLPVEVKEYVVAILKENAEELLSLEDVQEAVGEHIQASSPESSADKVKKTYERLPYMLHGDNLPKINRDTPTTKKLEQTVDMAADNEDFSALESIWKVQSRDTPTIVDMKKLVKTDNRAQAKADARSDALWKSRDSYESVLINMGLIWSRMCCGGCVEDVSATSTPDETPVLPEGPPAAEDIINNLRALFNDRFEAIDLRLQVLEQVNPPAYRDPNLHFVSAPLDIPGPPYIEQ